MQLVGTTESHHRVLSRLQHAIPMNVSKQVVQAVYHFRDLN